MDSTEENTAPPENGEERVDPEEGIDAIVPEEREFLTQNRGTALTQKNIAKKYVFKILLFISPYIAGVFFSLFLVLFSNFVLFAPAISIFNALPPNTTIKLDLDPIKSYTTMYGADGEVFFGKKLPNDSNYLFNNALTTPSCVIEFCNAASFETSYLSKETTEACLYYLNGVEGGKLSLQKISPFPQYYTETEFLGFPFNRSRIVPNNYNLYPLCTFQPNNQTPPDLNVSTSGLYLLQPGTRVSIPTYNLNHSKCTTDPFSLEKIPSNHSLFIKTTNDKDSSQFCSMFIQSEDPEKVDKMVACFFGSLIYTFICLIACDIAKFLYSFFFKKKTE